MRGTRKPPPMDEPKGSLTRVEGVSLPANPLCELIVGRKVLPASPASTRSDRGRLEISVGLPKNSIFLAILVIMSL